jgi:hypothetical protein
MKEKKHQEAEKLLNEQMGISPSSRLSVLKYLQIQNLLIQGKHDACINVFKLLDECKLFKLGAISSLITLFKHKNDKDSVSKLFADAIDFFSKSNQNFKELEIYAKENSNFQISCSNLEKACEMLEKMRSFKPTDSKILSKLINIYSKIDNEKAKKYFFNI